MIYIIIYHFNVENHMSLLNEKVFEWKKFDLFEFECDLTKKEIKNLMFI